MYYLKWAFWITVWGLIAAFLHYTLPHQDVVRIADTYEQRIDFGENSIFWANQGTGNAEGMANRDVFFIQAFRPSNRPSIYRNEDTGWGWPPYFKFDTANLQAEANNLRSTQNDPQWVVLRHYGWRNEFLSIYPNAISVRAVDGPDVTIIPWLNIVILIVFFAVVWAVWVRWRRFRRARIDPVFEDIGDGFDAAGDSFADTRGRIRRWLDSWKSKR
ncbi:DUF1523 family protein [Lacimonas salitolerans]|uniref:DUF1523 family protein n=1 Tax=Lacimonas salitolerans TaxID=1323750 RepID=A0ABW4EFW0_9RHOB